MNNLTIDSIDFYEYTPNTFTNLSRNTGGLIATSHSDGSVDVYDEKDNFFLLHSFPAINQGLVCALCWINDDLYVAGSEGKVFLLDFCTLTYSVEMLLPGGLPCRCLLSKKRKIIAGNDGGYITVLKTSRHDIQIKKHLQKLEGKVLCLAIDINKSFLLAAGDSNGKVHLIDTRSGNVFSTFSLSSESTHKIIVWSLLFVGGDLFSGDSEGTVNIWNVELGAVINSFKSHKADVLVITASPDNKSVYVGGVDPVIRRFDYASTNKQTHWLASGLIHGCRRDIHGLAFIPRCEISSMQSSVHQVNRLLAVGDDARLTILACDCPITNKSDWVSPHNTSAAIVGHMQNQKRHSFASAAFMPIWLLALAPSFPTAAYFAYKTFSDKLRSRLCLLQYPDRMCLVHLPRKPKKHFNRKMAERMSINVAEIKPKRGEQVFCCTISACGQFIAYSDSRRSRILNIFNPEAWKSDMSHLQKNVKISRHGWLPNNKKRRRVNSRPSSEERTASTGSGTSDLDSDSDEDRLFLDQSSANLFTDPNNAYDEQLNNKVYDSSHKSKKSCLMPTDQSDSCSALPVARLLHFTPDSKALISLYPKSQKISYLDLSSGIEEWSFIPDEANIHKGLSFHIIKVDTFNFYSRVENELTPTINTLTVLALCCIDGRVVVHCCDNKGQHLFTAPTVSSSQHTTPPRSVAVAFNSVAREDETVAKDSNDLFMTLRLSILYTTGQLCEWNIPITRKHGGPSKPSEICVGKPSMDPWLRNFWIAVNEEWRKRLPYFHSMDYLGKDGNQWILSSSRFIVYIDRQKNFCSSDVKRALSTILSKHKDCSIRITSRSETVIQSTVLPDRIAVVNIDTPSILLQLPMPFYKKQFGT